MIGSVMRSLIVIAAIAVLFAVLTPSANACSCGSPGLPCEAYGAAAAVFVGTPISIRQTNEMWTSRAVKFSVEQSYLGVAGTEVEVFTGSGGGDCGYYFEVGQRYLVYAYRNRNKEHLTTSICSRTRPYARASEDIAFLGNLTSQPSDATIFGQIVRRTTLKKNGPPISEDIVVRIEGSDVRREIRPDPHGHYRLAGLAAGNYKVTLQLPDELTTDQPVREITVSSRGCASLVFYVNENGRISGQVVDIAGRLVPNIIVSLVEPSANPRRSFVTLDRTDEEGRFNFSSIASGRYLIAVNFNLSPDPNDPAGAYPPTFYPGVSDQASAKVITLEVGEKRTGLEVQMPLPRTPSVINGQVVWADGSPVASGSVVILDRTYSESGMRRGIDVDEQGRFTIDGYVGQKLTLEAHAQRIEEAGRTERSEPVKITLRREKETVKIVVNKNR